MTKDGRRDRRNRLLAALSEADFSLLFPFMQPTFLDMRFNMQRPGERIEWVYFPETAIASIVALAGDDSRVQIALIGNEGLVGFPVVLGSERSPDEVFIQVPGAALKLRPDHLRGAMQQSETLQNLLLAYVHAVTIQISHTALANGKQKLESRLARWILMCLDRVDGDELPLTHEFISIMLGVRRPGVTVALHTLEGKGWIRTGRGRIHVLDRTGLEESAMGFYGIPEREYRHLVG